MRDDRTKSAVNVAEYDAVGVTPSASDFPLSRLQSLIAALGETGIWVIDDAANDPQIADIFENFLSKANVKSIMYVAIRVEDDVPAAFALSATRQLRHRGRSDFA